MLAAVAVFFAGCGGGLQPKATAGDDVARLDFRQVIRHAKDKVFPAVVFIKCLRESNESGEKITQEVAGSGVIISPAGEVLTNWHVVDKATEVRCLLYDGRAMYAKVLGSDKDTDLALLHLQGQQDALPFQFAPLGDASSLKEGDFVMAMGAPWGLSRSVSLGIISCTRRYLPERGDYNLWVQTDASISPGNSGGPLVNTAGEVIGITALGTLMGGDLGFAIPADVARHMAAQLKEFGRANWSWTGIQLQPLKDFNRNMYFEGSEGVIVAETYPESPARRAGVQRRDRILKVNGQKITATTEEGLPAVRRLLGMLPKDKPADLEILRDDKAVTIQVTPREKGKVEGDELACKRWDLTVKTINEFDNPDLYFHKKQGVFIFGTKYPGNAATAGLQTQDIILKIDGRDVTTLDDVKAIHKEALDNIQTKHKAIFTVLRGGLMRQVVVDYSRDYEKE